MAAGSGLRGLVGQLGFQRGDGAFERFELLSGTQQDGPLHILDDNYDDITAMIDDKIAYEQRRISTYASNLRKRFSKVDSMLGTYDKMQSQLESQIKQLSSD